MTKWISLLLIIGWIFSTHQVAMGQTNQSSQFLQTVGVLDSVYSERLKEFRKFFLQLPVDYQDNRDKQYPLVFIIDGEVLLPTVNNVQGFYGGGFIPEAILIAISNDQNRTRDLTTSKINDKNRDLVDEAKSGAADFSNFIEAGLIPYVENNYRATNYRTLIGHSYGGLFTIYTLLNHPYLFSNYLAIDPSLDWDDQKLIKEAQETLTNQDYHGKSLFISLNGQLHMQKPQVTIENVMQDTSVFILFARSNIIFSNTVKQNNQNGLNFKWKFYPRELHGTIPFPSIMDGLIALFDGYQWEETDKFNSPDTPKEEILKIVNDRANKLQSHFGYSVPPYPEDILIMSGYMNMDMQQPDKTKMYFELAINYYPQSANAYDSMADYYEAAGDIANAIRYVAKAFEISGKDQYKDRMKKLEKRN